uniref:Uncharacterized protein n=1 Tax=Panagrolaimus sp. PS1159 TaxID=55785 RepID=A0AC35EZE8_9BILA
MLLKTLLIKRVFIKIGEETHVNINDDIQFNVTIPPTNENVHIYQIQIVKGDVEIKEIRDSDDEVALPYDRIDNTFASNYHFNDGFVFHILANLNFRVVNEKDEHHCLDTTFKLQVSNESMSKLKPYECFEKSIIFNDLKDTILSCYIKKIDFETVEIHIVNPHHVGINGKNSDFRIQKSAFDDIAIKFAFDLSTPKYDKH